MKRRDGLPAHRPASYDGSIGELEAPDCGRALMYRSSRFQAFLIGNLLAGRNG